MGSIVRSSQKRFTYDGGHFQSCRWNDKEKKPAINGNIKYLDQEILVLSDVDGYT